MGTASVWQPVTVKVGEHVKKGSTLIVLEAMKMEIPIVAPCDGEVLWVSSTAIDSGKMVQQGEVLVVVKSSGGSEDTGALGSLTRKVPFHSPAMSNDKRIKLENGGTKRGLPEDDDV